MKHLLAVTAALALAALPALASEATFERTLSVSGKVELSVSTGSGNIHLTPGSGNRVHIFGRVKSGWGGSDERVGDCGPSAHRADGQHRPHRRPPRKSPQHQHRL